MTCKPLCCPGGCGERVRGAAGVCSSAGAGHGRLGPCVVEQACSQEPGAGCAGWEGRGAAGKQDHIGGGERGETRTTAEGSEVFHLLQPGQKCCRRKGPDPRKGHGSQRSLSRVAKGPDSIPSPGQAAQASPADTSLEEQDGALDQGFNLLSSPRARPVAGAGAPRCAWQEAGTVLTSAREPPNWPR